MGFNFRLSYMIVSLILTITLFAYHIYLFYKYLKRGRYHYVRSGNEMYMVIKTWLS